MKWKFLGILGTILILCASFVPQAAYAAPGSSCGRSFLGFKPWYDGLCTGSGDSVEIVPVCDKDDKDGGCPAGSKTITTFIWTIVLNILFDLGLAVGVIATIMVIYGGYMYIMSQGDPGKMAKAKRSLTTAITGTIIAMGATVIVNTFKLVLGINADDGWNQGTVVMDDVRGVFNWAYGAAGLVAVIFIIKSGVDYLISQGDPGKIRKATQGLIFSIVGLVIVLLAAVITGFVISSVGGAM